MGMGPCPTGYCGHPCTCPDAYSHTGASDAKAVIGILQKRLTKLAEDAASKEHGKPMVECATKRVVIKVLRCDHAVYQVDLTLNVFVPNPDPESINSLGGIYSIFKDGDSFRGIDGWVEDAAGYVSYEIVNYKGQIAMQCVTQSNVFEDLTAYVGLEDGKTFLPQDVLTV
jgi:hypothetical protein